MSTFKFLKGYIGTIDTVPGQLFETHATASFNNDTPEGHMNRRRLYHVNQDLYERLRNSDNELEQFYLDRQIRERTQEEILRESFHYGDNRNFFPPTKVTRVKETFWTKFKDVMKESWSSDPTAVTAITILSVIIIFMGVAKLFGA